MKTAVIGTSTVRVGTPPTPAVCGGYGALSGIPCMAFAAIADGCLVVVLVQENMLLALSRQLAHGDKPSYGEIMKDTFLQTPYLTTGTEFRTKQRYTKISVSIRRWF
jgi:hypothetical protein